MAELSMKLEPFGPTPQAVRELVRGLPRRPDVQAQLKGTRNRMLSFRLLEPETKEQARPVPPNAYEATFYDYTNNRALLVRGGLRAKRVDVSEAGTQPLPSQAEFDEALAILREDHELGALLREQTVQPYQAMPPLLDTELPDGRIARTIAVGFLPLRRTRVRHEIVGVNLITKEVIRFADRAPATAVAHNPICGLPYGTSPASGPTTPGLAWVTVSEGGTVLWRFQVARPAVSSGLRGSGVELRYVDYRGKRVLYRAHVPILNVLYDAPPCGPYRDWQNSEDGFQATGSTPVPGFRLCPSPAQTILDSGNDSGNFRGVAIYVQGQEVVLVSELNAGWYRYISQWRLHVDGTIRPRFGFSAVQNSCVCTRHIHHPYWRFDFDIRTAGNNVVREFNDPPIVPGSNWHTKHFEIKRYRDPSRKRRWRVEHAGSGKGYDLIPGVDDGMADSYARGDVWILRYRGTELEDGHNATTGPPGTTEADLDKFVNGEVVEKADVVLWYAAHIAHDVAADPPGLFGHWSGPDLVPHKW
jgi:Copper amine oxidase, enzyme domain